MAAIALLLNAWSLAGTMVAFGAVDAGAERAQRPRAQARGPGRPARRLLHHPRPLRGLDRAGRDYDFDNEPFLTALEERGFHVARHAHANYIKTPLSLVSSLNMDFLDTEALKAEAETATTASRSIACCGSISWCRPR